MSDALIQAIYTKYTRPGSPMLYWDFYRMMLRLSEQVEEVVHDPTDNFHSAFALIDQDGNGQISFHEFRSWWRGQNKLELFHGEKSEYLRKAYRLYRRYSRERGLTISSFGRMLDDLQITHTDDDFDALDQNENGVISFPEFCTWLNWF